MCPIDDPHTDTLACALGRVDDVIIGKVKSISAATSPSRAADGQLLDVCNGPVQIGIDIEITVVSSLKSAVSGEATVRVGPGQLEKYVPMPLLVDGELQWFGKSEFGGPLTPGEEIGFLVHKIDGYLTILDNPLFFTNDGVVEVQKQTGLCSPHGFEQANGLRLIDVFATTAAECTVEEPAVELWIPTCMKDVERPEGCILDIECGLGRVCKDGECQEP
jgi:hypothetical protein